MSGADKHVSAYVVVENLFALGGGRKTAMLLRQTEPDLSVNSAFGEIVLTLPGVTGSLLVFVLFGTTKQFLTKYVELFRSVRFPRRRRPSTARSVGGADDWVELGSQRSTAVYQPYGRTDAVSSVELEASEPPATWRRESKLAESTTSPLRDSYMSQALPSVPHR